MMDDLEEKQTSDENENGEVKNSKQYKPGISILGAIGYYLGFILILGVVISIPSIIILELQYFKARPVASGWIRVITQAIAYMISIKLILSNVADRGIGKPSFIGALKNNSRKSMLIGIVLLFGTGFFLVSHNSVTLIQKYMTMPKFLEEAFEGIAVSPVLMVTSIVVVAPIFEEIICRGIFLEGFLKRYNQWVALTASAILFGAIHGNLPQFLYATVLGLALGYVYMKTKSLILSIMLHALNNLAAILCAALNMNIGDKFNIFYFAIGIILLVVAIKYINKYSNKFAEIPNTYIGSSVE